MTTASSSNRSLRRRCPTTVADAATAIGERLATAMDLVGTLTVELFLLSRRIARRQRARAARPQQRPLDDRRRRDVAVRAAHPGDLRAAARLDRRAGTDRRRQRLGRGPRRPARLTGVFACPGRPGRPPPPVRQARGLRTPQDGPPDGARDATSTMRSSTPGTRWRASRGPTSADGGDGRSGRGGRPPMTEADVRPVVGVVGGSRSDFPTLEAAVASSTSSAFALSCGSCRRIGRPTRCSATPRRRGPRHPGDRRGRRRRGAPARDARREDDPAGHRRPHPDAAPRRARFAAVDRPDAARRAGRDGGDRQRHERRPAGGCDPCPQRRAGRAPRRVASASDPGRPR